MASNEAMQEESSNATNGGGGHHHHDDLELGLALTLGGGCGGGGSSWGGGGHELYGRILTAKDFPNGFSSSATRSGPSVQSHSVTAISNNQVVGWPPIRAYRMNTLVSQAKTQKEPDTTTPTNNKLIVNGDHTDDVEQIKDDDMIICRKNVNNDIGFVKVNMDGIPIGRKVNLKAHLTYDALANTVEDMFFNSNSSSSSSLNGEKKKTVKLLDSSSEFVLTYEDRDGDWMLLGDVPWGMFISNVKRLRIMRTFEANGLSAPRLQAKK
ncbi:auxin-responsive protein IAA13-like isoform X2 [Impatiens glandulifera]|uniref:auxin-responsive protein IAA13-like isoform X2 n=1 Tax=Impatiens glandulifera TaxID=253017 RepID=UPI001FB18529|nr:auxin-responsive protein IAA13-like isoform X2 [Impatiens glandulifera]